MLSVMKGTFSRLWRKSKSKPLTARGQRSAEATPQAARAVVSAEAALPPAGMAAIAWIGENGAAARTTAQLESRSAESVRVYLDEAIGTSQPVWLILDDGAGWPGMIQRCESEGQGFRVQIGALDRTQSSEAGSVHKQLKWVDGGGRLAQTAVSLKNADQGRLQVVIDKKLAGPAIVLLAGKGFQCLGSVTGCAPHEDRWTLDLEVLGEAYSRPTTETARSA